MFLPSNPPVTANAAGRTTTIDRTSDVVISDSEDSLGERALIEAAQAGDREAFGQLVLLHERAAVRTALAALGRLADAEDVAQDGFLLAWRKLAHFRGDASFRTWLLTIVWRQAMARRRTEQRWWQRLGLTMGGRGTEADDERFVEQIASDGPSPEDVAVGRSQARRVARAIATLSPKLRDTLLLAVSDEHAYEEIGRMLGAPVGTVKWRVAEARRQVSKALEGHHEA